MEYVVQTLRRLRLTPNSGEPAQRKKPRAGDRDGLPFQTQHQQHMHEPNAVAAWDARSVHQQLSSSIFLPNAPLARIDVAPSEGSHRLSGNVTVMNHAHLDGCSTEVLSHR